MKAATGPVPATRQPTASPARLDRLINAVQHNCHVSDARHARGMTLCTYLLEMREFFRWEHGIPLGQTPLRSEVGPWLAAREALWETLADADFVPLPLDGHTFDPFAVADINAHLLPAGLLYGAGIGRFRKPHFFLGRLHDEAGASVTWQGEGEDAGSGASQARVLVCACEYARDLTAIPAALQGDTIVVRQEALRQWLWEKAEAWGIRQQAGPMRSALAAWGYFDDAHAALERMTVEETAAVILHEQGEFAAGRVLGPAWQAMLAGMDNRRAELLVRAVRDNLADCLVTLPRLVGRDDASGDASLHFWFANFDGLRRELFPALVAAYAGWSGGGARAPLAAVAARGALHWRAVAAGMLADFARLGEDAAADFERHTHDLAPVAL